MNQIAITTSQNVNIDFTIASIGERMLAFGIDMLIKIAYLILVHFIFFKLYDLESLFDHWDNWSIAAVLIIITSPVHLYTLVLESLMEGQTFGKKITKIKVIKINGYQAGFGDYLMRWVFRLVDVYSNSGVVGLIAMSFTENNQRLGGLATGTAVISLKSDVLIDHTIIENIAQDYLPKFPQVLHLTDNDMRIIKDHFNKAQKNNDHVIIHKLSNKIKSTLNIGSSNSEFTDREFINTVIKDYNYYTGRE